ncbi:MAG: tRNA preQ1(34) S-adenosylmethionine ribosyltransferase-isomerase QueA [Syntrophobacteraceae bacterium]|jgi:S-adenosylmethionine:tRNA ribosyltransferase-isomerase|nr:tRNA preQ1(34) S-adenosylmethionine ribosyltransferase-isomerase QueA [Syntrophobacteraceae bacterium]
MVNDSSRLYRLDFYDYSLPEELIAQSPLDDRSSSRLLVLNRSGTTLEHRRFEDALSYLRAGDVLVVNDTRVVPARLRGFKDSGGKVEILVLNPYQDAQVAEEEGYLCLLKASKPPRVGSTIQLGDSLELTVLSPVVDGRARVRFQTSEPLLDILDRMGETPLPPYIRPGLGTGGVDDRKAYQTVYASSPGAVAAPTAGLHFTAPLMESLERRAIERAAITLHVGYGTFSPIRAEDVRQHRMHSELVRVEPRAARQIQAALDEKRRVIAVGTTVVRALEWTFQRHGAVRPHLGLCDHYIYPGYTFKVVGGMITNFHLPRSSLMLLVSAFAGRDRILDAYREAIRARYRFFSFGDAMLIL